MNKPIEKEPVDCCCGHTRWEHRTIDGYCRVCGPRGCEKFHATGEGHGVLAHVGFIFLLGVAGLVVCAAVITGLWAFVIATGLDKLWPF